MSDLVLDIEYDPVGTAREAVCALLDQLAEWGDLRFGKPRIDEESSEGRIAVIDRPPTAQIRSAQARHAQGGKDGRKRMEPAGRQAP